MHFLSLVFISIAALASPRTPSGIELDSAWKQKAYAFVQEKIVHPSWGVAHAERNYHLTLELARAQKIEVDTDALFAAAFFHDIGGIVPFDKAGVDHALRSVEVAEPLLREFGFPMAKWPLVSDIILGHVYYGPAPTGPSAKAFRDADILDFLGAIGVARLLAVTLEGRTQGTLKPMVDTIRTFAETLPGKCSLESCRRLATTRARETRVFLRNLDRESLQGKAL